MFVVSLNTQALNPPRYCLSLLFKAGGWAKKTCVDLVVWLDRRLSLECGVRRELRPRGRLGQGSVEFLQGFSSSEFVQTSLGRFSPLRITRVAKCNPHNSGGGQETTLKWLLFIIFHYSSRFVHLSQYPGTQPKREESAWGDEGEGGPGDVGVDSRCPPVADLADILQLGALAAAWAAPLRKLWCVHRRAPGCPASPGAAPS